MEMSPEEFTLLRDFIYEKTGIFYEEKKLYYLRTRVGKRAVVTNCSNITEYYRFLKYQKSDDELRELINLVTVNETYFFRDIRQMTAFSDEVLPKVIEEKRKSGDKSLKIWSSACSTGEEPYTIAILLKEKIKDIDDWKIEILASDINTQVIRKCEEGLYVPRSVKNVPDGLLNKYFTLKSPFYAISDEIKKMVSLRRLNLCDSNQVKRIKNIDILFCRNVLIYFDDKVKKQIINDFFNILIKGGYILLGIGESFSRISASFELVRLQNSLVYKK